MHILQCIHFQAMPKWDFGRSKRICPANYEICILITMHESWIYANCYLSVLCFLQEIEENCSQMKYAVSIIFFLMKDPSSLSTPCNVCHALHAVSEPSDLLTFCGQIKVWCNFPWVPSDTTLLIPSKLFYDDWRDCCRALKVQFLVWPP